MLPPSSHCYEVYHFVSLRLFRFTKWVCSVFIQQGLLTCLVSGVPWGWAQRWMSLLLWVERGMCLKRAFMFIKPELSTGSFPPGTIRSLVSWLTAPSPGTIYHPILVAWNPLSLLYLNLVFSCPVGIIFISSLSVTVIIHSSPINVFVCFPNAMASALRFAPALLCWQVSGFMSLGLEILFPPLPTPKEEARLGTGLLKVIASRL